MVIPHPFRQVLLGWEGVMVRWGTGRVVYMKICDNDQGRVRSKVKFDKYS